MAEMTIKNHYNSLSSEERVDFVYNVCKLCGISIPTFYKRLQANSFKAHEIKLVTENLLTTV